MEKKRLKYNWKRGGKIIILAFLIGFILRLFVIESVYISTSQMEKTYSAGDLVFVLKSAYGIQFPFSSVSFFSKPVTRNDIVLTRIPHAGYSAKVLSRCVGLPGDTISFLNGQLTINNSPLATPPTLLPIYDNGKGLSKLEAYLAVEGQAITIVRSEKTVSYQIVVPKAGTTIVLDSITTMPFYESVFAKENEGKVVFIKDQILYIEGQKQTHYLFKENYYWVLADNRENGIDSRHFGFVQEKNIEGKALKAWLNCNFVRYE